MSAKSITNKPQTLSNDILMRSIKIIDIGYISVLYIAFSVMCATVLDKIMGDFDEQYESTKPLWQLTAEFFLIIWFYGVLIYVVRNLVELIPFPLDKYHGFEHKRVKELSSAMVFTFTFVLFSSYLKKKLDFYYKFIKIKII